MGSSCRNNSEISKAMKNATEKATAAVNSINEQYKISEGLANAVSVVERKGLPSSPLPPPPRECPQRTNSPFPAHS